ncbi:4534_t:CDS:2 [Funneliformis geosporum]|uniref:7811_t:CDS:1 n=1 Tax=Funneliformis geosporum TaxID=1117311 RepID=A0A9W4SPE3_9GLOM|nr:4534_t:CDS:2 [Funneliformis geosporum]CAI2176722.1 7811_t:CDS:2 [Funneliformis geosporum]
MHFLKNSSQFIVISTLFIILSQHIITSYSQEHEFKGRGTFFDPGLGACGQHSSGSDLIVALNAPQFGNSKNPNENPMCGKKVTITGPKGTVTCKIVDRCPGCPFGALDLSRAAFDKISTQALGVTEITWKGDSDESVGSFLRGELILNLSNPTRIRKIDMRFTGRMKTFWPEGKIYYGSSANRNELCEEQEIMAHDWTFVPPPNSSPKTSPPSPISSTSGPYRFSVISSSPSDTSSSIFTSSSRFHLIPAGIHKYPFELFVPGKVPETIEAVRGTVNYKLSAAAIRSGLFPNLHVSQRVPIIRTILEERNSEGIAIASNWNDQLDYEITIPKRAYPMGDSIDIDLKLTPRVKRMQVVGVKIQIDEESLYKARGQKNIELRNLSLYKDEDFCGQEGNDLENLFYQKNISFPIPKSTNHLHYSCETTSIKISHLLKFVFTIKLPYENYNNKKKKAEVKVDVPITILSSKCAEDLPQYADDIYCPFDDNDNNSSRNSTLWRNYLSNQLDFVM